MFALVPNDMCLINSATTYTILKSNKFFSCLIIWDINVSIIYSITNIFKDSRRAIILKDICLNGYYIETNNEKRYEISLYLYDWVEIKNVYYDDNFFFYLFNYYYYYYYFLQYTYKI